MSAAEQSATARERRARNQFRRRQEILEAAAEIFASKGYESASTKDIANAVGILKGSLYYYVESKEDFLYEIIREVHDGGLASLERVRLVDGDALTRLAVCMGAHLRFYASNLSKAIVFFREFRHLSPERQALINEEGSAYLEFIRELLRQGQAEGSIVRSIDVRLVSIGIVGMLNSMWQWYNPAGRRSIDEIAGEFVSVIVQGLASEKAMNEAGGAHALRDTMVRNVARGEPAPDGVDGKPKRAGRQRPLRAVDASSAAGRTKASR